jgi:hypothetical protein
MGDVEHIGVSDEMGEVVEERYRPSTQATAEEVAKLSYEPPRVRRRPFGLSHAAMAGCSSMA